MNKGRLLAFSDGVIAVIITIMVLELKAPHGSDLHALATLWPVFLSYVLSYVYVGIYWNNHHHIMRAVDIIDGGVMWANLHQLFWLSLIPFATACLVRCNGADSAIARALGDDRKGKRSLLLYLVATASAFIFPIFAYVLYFAVSAIWFVPDRRVERVLADEPHGLRAAENE